MRQNKFGLMLAAAFAVVMAGCGGVGPGNPTNQMQYSSQVVFGDSLSDVGSYAVGLIAGLQGGRFTVNSTLPDNSLAKTNWTELIATQLGLPAPCPAQTGLNGSVFGFVGSVPIPILNDPDCTNYAQGGARVTDPDGPGNINLAPELLGSPQLGQLTVPIEQQIQNHLTLHGDFVGDEIVFLFAGGNDAIVNTLIYVNTVGAALQQGGPAAAQAAAATAGPVAVQAMVDAATDLALYVNRDIVNHGANYVVVVNLPDLSLTPFGTQLETSLPGTRALIDTMVTAFNTQLQANLTSPKVLVADLHTPSVDQLTNPGNYLITNATTPACDTNALNGSSLICSSTTGNVIAGDISRYAFADSVHPTPYGYSLIAQAVALNLAARGWL